MASNNGTKKLQVAIVGSGMAGLVTAYLLSNDPHQRYAVKIFESGKTLSLDSASVSIPNATKTAFNRVDLPMRAFAGGFYSNLKAMYDHLGVKYHSQPFLFEFAKSPTKLGSRLRSDSQSQLPASSYFVHASNLHETPPPRPRALPFISYILEVVYLLVCYAWFSLCCFLVAPLDGLQGAESLEEYLRRTWVPEYFISYYVLPLISSVTTCPHQSLLGFPASDVIGYKRRTHNAPHYTVSNGVNTVQERLIKGVNYELSAPISKVTPTGNRVKLTWKKVDSNDAEDQEETFDKVIMAVAPDIVGQIFGPLQHFMRRIPTVMVESVVHSDKTMLKQGSSLEQRKSRLGAQLIYLRTTTDNIHQTESHHVQNCGSIVTTCPIDKIDDEHTIHSATFTRVLRTPESKRIVNSIFRDTPNFAGAEKSNSLWKNGDDNVFLVGGWCWDGMVLLEGCIVSAMRVANALNVEIPWKS
ncbi:FAD/NAD(P)-binding domain-containing protein [Aaosphaeria arxii CBS 175.79]|uniref:FAD/NAD(P)-binding domain-containing protein n=1 Tax=Aaosphaeria arxii CBS 175.79 TaxID=1450172 RepID=A0A6A5Y5T4_9PLEO|nr:FAD/NAD(P)-binding domain-containing protein [Aaosphaeria arxii CBS 175.79]KAF2020649.1 FAD/NAD(P)-binding domain-containing protein [Aaosphaeria arxii CBS 175.79]